MSYKFHDFHKPMTLTKVSMTVLLLQLRILLRSGSLGLILLASVIGLASGLLVAFIGQGVQLLHVVLFEIGWSESLSAAPSVPTLRLILVPVIGGAIISLIAYWVGGSFKNRLADAIEANALYGGRLSFRGSVLITAQTILSSGFGASVGLEAAYTQICAAIASGIGQIISFRRSDLRLLVACGAAGAIGAAFGAPLAGTFYAYEVVLGTYAVGALVPVVLSALIGSSVSGAISGHAYLIMIDPAAPIAASRFTHIVLIGLICSAISIVVMEAVAIVERAYVGLKVATPMRPLIGGLCVGLLALLSPQILGAGHGALHMDIITAHSATAILVLIVLKIAASALSLGSGFRGGLFFSSLLLGALTGLLYRDVAAYLDPSLSISPPMAALAGMAGLGTGVIGAPIAMTVLMMEMTGSYAVLVAALIASVISSLIVRETFGYSFATWRFHLRGQTIRGPIDVGWVRDLTVEKLMRPDVRTAAIGTSIRAMRDVFPLGSTKQVAINTAEKRYGGLVLLEDVYSAEDSPDMTVASLVRYPEDFLLPGMTVLEALDVFRRSEADALVVVDDRVARRVVGLASEAHLLRRYGDELERRHREIAVQ